MKRSKPLRANPATTRAWKDRSRQPLPRASTKTRSRWMVDRQIRGEVEHRDGGCIVRFVTGHQHGTCFGPPTFHHLRKASAGGIVSHGNGVCLCAGHNTRVEDHPAWAKRIGLVVNDAITPAEAWDRRVTAGLVVRTDRPAP